MNLTTYCNIFYPMFKEAYDYYASRADLNLKLVNGGNTMPNCNFLPDLHADENQVFNEWSVLHTLRDQLEQIDTAYVSFCHYRMFFKQLPSELEQNKDLYVGQDIQLWIRNPQNNFQPELCTNRKTYEICHFEKDFKLLKQAISHPLFEQWACMKTLVAPCQMFIMKKELFEEYFDWAWPKLQWLRKRIDLSERDNYQKRALAFLGERLLSFFAYSRFLSGKTTVGVIQTEKFDHFKPKTAKDLRGVFS